MSNAGQAALTIVGTAVGFFIGQPQLGFLLGSYAGSALFPTQLPTVRGPRLEDLKAQTSSLGSPIPRVYGTYAVAGNVIWASDLQETQHAETAGGKGGGPEQEMVSYSYSQSLAIGLCMSDGEAQIQGIRRIWANGKLIYDRSPMAERSLYDLAQILLQSLQRKLAASDNLDSIMQFYDGTQTAADPTIESFEGVGNVPAYMGLAYVVFTDLQLADYGNRAPNFQFEVYTSGSEFLEYGKYSNSVLYPWIDGSGDPRNSFNTHVYWNGSAYVSSPAGINAPKDYIYGFAPNPDGVSQVNVAPDSSIAWNEKVLIYGLSNIEGASLIVGDVPLSPNGGYALEKKFYSFYEAFGNAAGYGWVNGLHSDGVTGYYGDGVVQIKLIADPLWTAEVRTSYSDLVDAGSLFNNWDMTYWDDEEIPFKRTPRAPPNPMDIPGAIPIPGIPNAVIIDGDVYRSQDWNYVTGTFKVLAQYRQTAGSDAGGVVEQYPLNPCLPSTSDYYSDEAFWTAAYDAAVTAGDIPAGLTYGVDYPVVQGWAYENGEPSGVIDVLPVLVADIVDDICAKEGMDPAQYYTSSITKSVDGYAITTVSSGRAAIEPLMVYALFECVESDTALKFVTRGGAAVATLDSEDMGAHPAGNDRPTVIDVQRTQDKELTRRLIVTYASSVRDYQPGAQASDRLTTAATREVNLQIPVSMGDTAALQLAEVHLFDEWMSRNIYKFGVPNSWLRLEPTDCINVPVDDYVERVRILSTEYSAPGVISITAVRDDAAVVTSYAARTALEVALASASSGEPTLIGPSDLVLLDIPALRSTDNDAGYYAAARGYLPSWAGFAILRSFDGGTEYVTVSSTTDAATMGTLIALQDSPAELTLTADSGSFSAATEAQLDAGANLIAVGAHGRWELIQFDTASLTNGVWTLGIARRGLKGTDANQGTSVVGDRVVLLSGAGILRIPLPASLVGVSHLVKAVSIGNAAADTTAVAFTSSGLSLQSGGLTFDDQNNLVSDEIYRQVFGP